MTKTDFVKEVADKLGMRRQEVHPVLKAIEEEILIVMAKEDFVRFDFGTLGGRTVAPRKYNNPRTGQLMLIPEKHGQPYYKASIKAKA